MKKKLFILTLAVVLCLTITACGKEKEEEKENEEVETGENIHMVGGWETVLTDKQVGLEEAEIKIFNDAKEKYTGLKIEPVALLGKQLVAGTNYMFLAKGTPIVQNPTTSYKIVVVYNDLQGKSSITSVLDFDFSKYTNKNVDYNSNDVVGGWTVEAPGKLNVLDDEEVSSAWEKVTKTLTGMSYNPIAVVGKQLVSGTNYAVLCYGKASTNGNTEGVYLLTLYKDLEGKEEIVSHAYINLADFN